MKKKGFTLIEMLGVIVILAVIALITIPIITGIINNVRKKAFENTAYGLMESARIFYTKNLGTLENIDDYTYDFGQKDGNLKLEYKGVTPIGGTISLCESGQIELDEVTDGKYVVDKSCSEVAVSVTKYDSSVLSREDLTKMVKEMQSKIETLEKDNEELKEASENASKKLTDKNFFLKSHPVGSIYVTVASDENSVSAMESKYSGTEWEVYGAGRTLIGVGSNGTTNYATVGVTGGNTSVSSISLAIANLPSHTHEYTPKGTIVSQFSDGITSSDGAHQHGIAIGGAKFNWPGGTSNNFVSAYGYGTTSELYTTETGYKTSLSATHNHTVTGTVTSTFNGTKSETKTSGSGSSFNAQDPYITVYMYKRTK